IYDQMMPLCKKLIDVSRGIAGFAALWYIAYRVWRHIANAEPIDFYPLLRPFALGICILAFPAVLGLINGVMKPTVTATAAMMNDSHQSVKVLIEMQRRGVTDPQEIEQAEQAMKADPDRWDKYNDPHNGPSVQPIASASFGFGLKAMIKRAVAEILYL